MLNSLKSGNRQRRDIAKKPKKSEIQNVLKKQ